MSISYPLSHPATAVFRALNWRAMDVIAITRSPFTLREETQAFDGDAWGCDVDLPPMDRIEADAWIAWALALRGRLGTFHLGDPTAKTPKGIATGTPLVDGTQAAASRTLATKGWTTSTTGILKAGDFIELGSGATRRLHRVLKDANADGAGKATLDIWPALRLEGAANNAAIVTANCAGTFRLATNAREWSVGEAKIYGLSFSAVEAL